MEKDWIDDIQLAVNEPIQEEHDIQLEEEVKAIEQNTVDETQSEEGEINIDNTFYI